MASLLAGGVVVILGYASGIGITPTDAATAAPPAAPPSAATAPPASTTPPPATAIAQPVMPGTSTMPDMPVSVGSPHPAAHDPEPAEPEPTEPEPSPTDTCPPSVLEGLPAVGETTSTLLSSVLSSAPVVSDLAGPPAEGKEAGPLTCLVGTLVGPTCCATTTATATPDAE